MDASSPYVYDKAKYHYETIEKEGLSDDHASNHAVPILRWLIENDLMSEMFLSEGSQPLQRYRAGELTIHDLYGWWDNCLISDMLSRQGNAFAMHYFDYQHGKYIADYIETLQGDLPTEFHVRYTEDNYARIRTVIDERYGQWKRRQSSAWWQIWK